MIANSQFIQMKKSVAFIYLINDERQTIDPHGTGFFVSVPVEGKSDRVVGYFVTAKHVLQDEFGKFLPEIFVRMNHHDGTSSYTRLELGKIPIFTHIDADVDIAVIPLRPRESLIDFLMISESLITTKNKVEELEIGEGDDVFFVGLFSIYQGQKKNQPIIRFGKVALMTDEKIEWSEKGKQPQLIDLYLLECQSFGGNSGSPVFFQLNPLRTPNVITISPPQIYLAGIMKGSFQTGSKLKISDFSNPMVYQNTGIAAVTPAYKLHDILFSENVIENRKNAEDY